MKGTKCKTAGCSGSWGGLLKEVPFVWETGKLESALR